MYAKMTEFRKILYFHIHFQELFILIIGLESVILIPTQVFTFSIAHS